MAAVFSRFDPADYLKSQEDIEAYLIAAAEDGDPAVLTAALGAIARARNMAQLARDAGMTREGLYKAFSPGGNPSFGTVARVAGALGFRVSFAPVVSPIVSGQGASTSRGVMAGRKEPGTRRK